MGRDFFISDAGIGTVRPFQLDGVIAYLLCFPGTDVANFTVILIVPSLSGDRVGDGFAQLMRTGRRECIECSQTTCATLTIGIGHYGVKDLPIDVVVIATECLTGA